MGKKARTMIVVSNDPKVIHLFNDVLARKEYSILVPENRLQAIWHTLDTDIVCFVVDLSEKSEDELTFINIIKKVKPRLPVVTLYSEVKPNSNRQLAETGIFYRAVKPLRVQEIEQVVEAIERRLLREEDCMSTSL